jgi:NADPH:quinone reductase
MRGIQITEYLKVSFQCHQSLSSSTLTISKGPDQLKVSDLPDPKPTDDEYLIQVHAAAANFFDILQIQGKYQNQPRKLIPMTLYTRNR